MNNNGIIRVKCLFFCLRTLHCIELTPVCRFFPLFLQVRTRYTLGGFDEGLQLRNRQ